MRHKEPYILLKQWIGRKIWKSSLPIYERICSKCMPAGYLSTIVLASRPYSVGGPPKSEVVHFPSKSASILLFPKGKCKRFLATPEHLWGCQCEWSWFQTVCVNGWNMNEKVYLVRFDFLFVLHWNKMTQMLQNNLNINTSGIEMQHHSTKGEH
jgi:hypothetical protein